MTRAELPEQIETDRLLLRVRTVADAEDIFDFASRPEVSYPAGFPPVKTLEDEIYYLEHILPDRNEKDNLPAGYGIVVKGTDKVIGSVDFNHRHEDDVLEFDSNFLRSATVDDISSLSNKERFYAFVWSCNHLNRSVSDAELLDAWRNGPSRSAIDEEDETEYEVERLTLDELAERINDECFNDTEDYVRFIQITD